MAAVVADPASMWPPAAFLLALLAYCLVRGVIGVHRAAGVKDGLLAALAFVKLAVGGAGVFVLWPGNVDLRGYDLPPWLTLALLVAALWCLVTGGVHFLLLTVGGGSPLRRITKHIRQTQIVMRPARRRRWWQFW